jgi:hypothetical protein
MGITSAFPEAAPQHLPPDRDSRDSLVPDHVVGGIKMEILPFSSINSAIESLFRRSVFVQTFKTALKRFKTFSTGSNIFNRFK